ncbi:MAG TPA: Rieske 2Fe-2S domain-containing protein [Rhizomicrobium sp.]|nr:Rieske 2Fe-2S domain-containing protein [Rhizomicrobium sp.]
MFESTGIKADDLKALGRKVLRRGGKQILLIAAEGRIFAVANRCPHEGYPLSEGTEGAGCVLTCNWHNWKFDLATGAALIGRDPVRTYAVELRDGEIFLDFADPPADAQRESALGGLDKALADNDMPRMAREVARLERAGFDAREALVHALKARNEYLENGMTHAHAAAADWLALAARAPDPDRRLAATLEPLAHLAWDTEGAGEFPYAPETLPWNAQAFLAAMEAEDEPQAVARMRGAIADRVPYAALRPVIAEAALAHYADFGHSAIYTLKAGQLIERLGVDAREAVLLALTRQQIQATREERLPEFRFHAKALAAWDGKGEAPASAGEFRGLSIDAALQRTLESSGRGPHELFDALLGAAAWNLLHFDTGYDAAIANPIADNVSWLDFTHALTFANAARVLCEERPDLWPRALLQMALFVGRNRGYVNADQDVARWRVDDPVAFIASGMASLYDHGIVEPIIACHRLKMLFALEAELAAAPDAPWAATMCAAMNRWLATPQKRHHGLRIAHQARDFIAREA